MNGENSEEKLSRLPLKKRYSLCENMFLSFMITFAAGAFCFEDYMPESFISLYKTAAITVCFITWLVLSFISGTVKRWQYAVFAAVFWILPQIIIYLSNEGPEVFRMSIIMYMLSEFAAIFTITPAEYAGRVIGMSAVPFMDCIAILCVLCFGAGSLLSSAYVRKLFKR